ncbi:MAG: SPASM domain-containing protein [Planctomycetota bacterium]
MKCIAVINVDLERSPLGTRSRLGDELAGKTVLRRTLERVALVKGVASIHLLCHVSQSERLRELTWGLAVKIEPHDAEPPPYEMLVRASRWWGLDSWRGGAGSLSVFDEDARLDVMSVLVDREQADAALSLPAAAVVIDQVILDAMIDQQRRNSDTAKMTFTPAPPGLAALLLTRELLSELAPSGQPPGVLMTYHPDRPIADLTGKEACYRPSDDVIAASGRLLADTTRSMNRLRDLFAAGGETWDASRIARWLLERGESFVEPVPSEIEIELTTDDPLSGTLLRPRGTDVGSRGPLRQSVVQSVIDAMSDYDDIRVVLAGHGEPTLHPAFHDICTMLRRSPAVAAIAVRTCAVLPADTKQSDAIEEALFGTPVDLVEVTLDASTAETYSRVQGVDAYKSVIARLNRWAERRVQRQQVRPLIMPSFVKANENMSDMEAFYDDWQGRLGMSTITGYSHHASQRPHRAVTSVAPPTRAPCRRTFSRAMILADGRMTTCDQDFAGKQCLGVVGQQSFLELWQAATLSAIRAGGHDQQLICPGCDEWHRP